MEPKSPEELVSQQHGRATTFDELWQRAQQEIKSQEYALARATLMDILDICQDLPREKRAEVLALGGKIGYWLGDYKGAKDDCNAALQLNPRADDAHITLGKIATNEYFFSKAQGHFATVQKPNSECELALCRLHIRLRNPSKARQHLSSAAGNISASHPEFKLYAAYLNLLEGNTAAAQQALSTSKEISKNPEAAITLAELMVTAGQYSAAQSLLNQLQTIIPANDQIYGLLAQCAFAQGEFQSAEQYAKRALIHNPMNLFAITVQMKAKTRQGEYDDAEELGLRILQLAPEYPLAHANLGDVYFAQGKFDEARSEYKVTQQHTGADTKGSKLRRARMAYMLGNYDEARSGLEQLLNTSDLIYDDAIADLHLIYSMLGLDEERQKLQAKMETRRAYSHRIGTILAQVTNTKA
ncbi:hypothetical protein COV82_02445 [Candidatus Peregrinibacteria bacterium CG11_big_fil_rev_8_21_14_0_20_46_8]|nr:MAG: hypothetical protein COV82_02445 [Candidatus Peregrinibacteria bacterium CG11_big_fil_rev_8_21_14_0_20_46_8]